MENTVYWIWLSLCLTPASHAFTKLRTRASSAKEIFDLAEEDIRRLLGTDSKEAERLCRRDLADAERVYEFCQKHGVGLLPFDADGYPPLLKTIPNPPVLLYYRGTLPDFSAAFPVAVVGTRRMTSYGEKSAFHIGMDLARAGALIVSGMALGIDGVAMSAALSVGGRTVAVLGGGIDICYPKEHLALARATVANGCIFSEYPPGTVPQPYMFPQRNRIISGLCPVTLVVEGRENSGALITARTAIAQGRTVYAVPGSIDEETSEVSHLLLKNGARVCTGADDILHDFEFVYTGIINPYALNEPVSVREADALATYGVRGAGEKKTLFRRHKEVPAPAPQDSVPDEPFVPAATLSEKETAVLSRVPSMGEADIESLVGDGFTVRDVMRCLLTLEIKGAVELLPGERVRRKT